MNKIQDADFMAQFPPALKKDKSMLALGKAIAAELHITARETRKNIIYANIEDLSETWLDVLAYDLHVDWYDYDYPVEVKRSLIKGSIKIHQKLGTKYAVETALGNVYKGAGISEWFEYGGRPYYFKINVDTSESGLSEHAYADILDKVGFYKNLRSHCELVSYRMHIGGIVKAGSATGLGGSLKVKPKLAGCIQAGSAKAAAYLVPRQHSSIKVKPGLAGCVSGRAHGAVLAGAILAGDMKVKYRQQGDVLRCQGP